MRKLIKLAKIYLPSWIKHKLDKKILNRKIKKSRERKKRVFILEAEVREVLNKLNLSGDIMVHASMSNIGKIEGGAPATTKAIIDCLDLNNDTISAPALPFMGSMKEYLDTVSLFDVETAKNCMGGISCLIMEMNGCFRSVHPTHSVIALGKHAKDYTNSHHLSKTPFGSTSPFKKLVERNGKILMFGVDLNSVTSFHVYEDMLGDYLPFDVYTNKQYKVNCKDNDLAMDVITRAHNPIVSAKRDCELSRDMLIECGAITTYKLGESEVSLLDAHKLTLTLLKMLKTGNSIYGKVSLDKLQSQKVDQIINELVS